MIDFQVARDLAITRVKGFERESGIALAMFDDAKVEFEDGWIFYWDSHAFLKTRDIADAIAGNAPIVVFKDGSIRQAPTAHAKADAILCWIRDHPQD